VAVAAFLEGRISFPDIARTIEQVLTETPALQTSSVQDVLVADKAARECARRVISGRTAPVSFART
jgi:1-deoxy-D-xylulose-5-phosphate reductoisomerase